jgi:hypothetical protein
MALAALPDRYPDLSTPLTSLIGREDDIASVAAMTLGPPPRHRSVAAGKRRLQLTPAASVSVIAVAHLQRVDATQAPSRLVAVNRTGALALPPRPSVKKSGQGNAAPAVSTRGYPTAFPLQASTEPICETGNLTDDGIVIGLALGHRRRG